MSKCWMIFFLLVLLLGAFVPLAAQGTGSYVVQPGDTLWALSGDYLGDPMKWEKLLEANQFLKQPGRVFRRDGQIIVLIWPGEQLKGLLDLGATATAGCCGIGSLDERELVRANYTDKGGNGEILVYAGPAAAQLTLKDLVDVAKLRAIKLDKGKGPVDVYLGSIATGVVTDNGKLKDAYFEHYFGTVRTSGVVSDIGCVRWPHALISLAKEKGSEGMINICDGMYPPVKKPKKLRAGVLSPKEGEIRYQ